MLIQFIFAALATFYITQVMLYEDKVSHFGPLVDETKWVLNKETNHTQPVCLFDHIRRATIIFNPYDRPWDDLWIINARKMERWTCPKCLSFWVSLYVTSLVFISNASREAPIDLLEYFFFLLAVAGASTLLSEVYNGLLRQKAKDEVTIEQDNTE